MFYQFFQSSQWNKAEALMKTVETELTLPQLQNTVSLLRLWVTQTAWSALILPTWKHFRLITEGNTSKRNRINSFQKPSFQRRKCLYHRVTSRLGNFRGRMLCKIDTVSVFTKLKETNQYSTMLSKIKSYAASQMLSADQRWCRRRYARLVICQRMTAFHRRHPLLPL